jgi:hypothetical protein
VTRIAQTEILCVYAPVAVRAHLRAQLNAHHPQAAHTALPSGWLVVESALGQPQSRFVGSDRNVRFVLGEEQLVPKASEVTTLEHIAWQAVNEPASLDRLAGDFSFVVLGAEGAASAVRSCSGNPRLFGFSRDGVTAIGSRLDWLARVYPEVLSFDAMRLAIELSALTIAPQFSSVLQGISLVPCGHVARWSTAGATRVTRYWTLPTQVEIRCPEQLAEAIEPELRAELRRHIDPNADTAVLVSGGLDSSLLFALAARETKRLDAVTTLPSKDHPEFTREQYFSGLAAAGCRQHGVFTLTPHSLVEHLRAAPGDLCPLGMEWFGLQTLHHQPALVISGWFADECWGFLRLAECLAPLLPNVPKLVRHAPFKRELLRFWLDRHRSGRFTFPPAHVDYPAILNPAFADGFRGWLASVSWQPRPERPAEKLRLHRWLTDMSGLYAEAAAYVGARAITPFTSRVLVELAARCDPHALFSDGLSKHPLRLIARRLLPFALAERLDKGDWAPSTPEKTVPAPRFNGIEALLDTRYLADHPSLSLDDVWSIEWLSVLERGRAKVEHERKNIWR